MCKTNYKIAKKIRQCENQKVKNEIKFYSSFKIDIGWICFI